MKTIWHPYRVQFRTPTGNRTAQVLARSPMEAAAKAKAQARKGVKRVKIETVEQIAES